MGEGVCETEPWSSATATPGQAPPNPGLSGHLAVWCHIYDCVQIDAVRDLDMMQEGAQRDRFTAKVAWNRCPLRESVVSIR